MFRPFRLLNDCHPGAKNWGIWRTTDRVVEQSICQNTQKLFVGAFVLSRTPTPVCQERIDHVHAKKRLKKAPVPSLCSPILKTRAFRSLAHVVVDVDLLGSFEVLLHHCWSRDTFIVRMRQSKSVHAPALFPMWITFQGGTTRPHNIFSHNLFRFWILSTVVPPNCTQVDLILCSNTHHMRTPRRHRNIL